MQYDVKLLDLAINLSWDGLFVSMHYCSMDAKFGPTHKYLCTSTLKLQMKFSQVQKPRAPVIKLKLNLFRVCNKGWHCLQAQKNLASTGEKGALFQCHKSPETWLFYSYAKFRIEPWGDDNYGIILAEIRANLTLLRTLSDLAINTSVFMMHIEIFIS